MEVIADSAEPKSIEEPRREGFNVKPARKGPDSVRQGIDIMRRRKLHIHADSVDLHKEFSQLQVEDRSRWPDAWSTRGPTQPRGGCH